MSQNYVAKALCTLVAGLLLSPSVDASIDLGRYRPAKTTLSERLNKVQPTQSPIKTIHTKKKRVGGRYTLADATVNTKTGEIFDTRIRDYDASNTLKRETFWRYNNKKVVYQAVDTNGDGSWDYEEEKKRDARGRIILNKVYQEGVHTKTITLTYSPTVDTSTLTDHQKKRLLQLNILKIKMVK